MAYQKIGSSVRGWGSKQLKVVFSKCHRSGNTNLTKRKGLLNTHTLFYYNAVIKVLIEKERNQLMVKAKNNAVCDIFVTEHYINWQHKQSRSIHCQHSISIALQPFFFLPINHKSKHEKCLTLQDLTVFQTSFYVVTVISSNFTPAHETR